jgi:hypothetical protein
VGKRTGCCGQRWMVAVVWLHTHRDKYSAELLEQLLQHSKEGHSCQTVVGLLHTSIVLPFPAG